jgi:hypothetical protein
MPLFDNSLKVEHGESSELLDPDGSVISSMPQDP